MEERAKSIATKLLIALFLYCLLGFLLVPGIILHTLNHQLSKLALVPAKVRQVEFNPFTLELTLWHFHLGEPDSPQLAFRRLHANLQLKSLWSGALHLADVELERAHTEVLFDTQGTLNLTQLFELPASEPESDKPEQDGIFPLRIDRLSLISNSLHFQDLRPQEPVEFGYDALDLTLYNLSTLPEDRADMRLLAEGPYGAQLQWQGQVSLSPLGSTGQLQLSDIQFAPFWPYVLETIPLHLKDGQGEFSSHYQLDLAQGTELRLENAHLQVTNLALDSASAQPLLRLGNLELDISQADLAAQQVLISRLASQDLEAWAAREADGELDWLKLLPSDNGTQPPAEQDHESSEASTTTRPWQLIVEQAQLSNYHLHLQDRQPEQPVALEVGPLNLTLSDFDSLSESPFNLVLDTGLGPQGQLKLQGQAGLNPISANLQTVLSDIDLRLSQSYIAPFINIDLRSGLLDSQLQIALNALEPLNLNVSGDARVRQLHVRDSARERDLLKWQQLSVEAIDYRSDRLKTGLIRIHQPYARLIINDDLSTNFSELLVPQPESTSSANDPGQPLAIQIAGIVIEDGSANFADFSLRPNFATALEQLNGRIGTLDNQRNLAASVNISGKVDRYAPVEIKGELTPFDPLNSLDIATTWRNLELTTLTPYSGKFAGYRIRKGRLNLDLHYRIQQGQLNADNKLLLEDLQLGERVDSSDAVNLPIRLAVALLKDTRGNIDIELPISGDLNNPEFRVMPIVWQTLRNLILRATQAPFKFIAGLVGASDADLSQISFAPGSVELDTNALQALDTLANALNERPNLALEVEGTSAQDSDGQYIAERRLERAYQELWYQTLQSSGQAVPATAADLQVDDKQKPVLLEAIYRSELGQQPPEEWQELNREERSNQLREALLTYWGHSSQLLRRLAQLRANSIKDYLVDRAGLDAERIYMVDVSSATPATDGSIASLLHLDSR